MKLLAIIREWLKKPAHWFVRSPFRGTLSPFTGAIKGASNVAPPTKLRSPAPAEASPTAPAQTNAKACLQIPLSSIVGTLPEPLRARVKDQNVNGTMLSFPTAMILPQCAKGIVTVTFGEVRKAASHAFTSQQDSDAETVVLPLKEVLASLHPEMLKPRNNKRELEIPSDILSPFESLASGQHELRIAEPPKKKSVETPKPAELQLPLQAPAPAVPLPLPPAPEPEPVIPMPAPKIPFVLPSSRVELPKASVSPLESAPVKSPAPKTNAVFVALKAVSHDWPGALCNEIRQNIPSDAQIALPVDLLGKSLKEGRVVFKWKSLRDWIRPAVQPTVSIHDQIELELPLKVVAPLFIAQRQSSKPQPREQVPSGDSMPNLFSKAVEPDAAVAPACDPSANSDSLSAAISMTQTEANKASALPREIIKRAMSLQGVTGAMIILSDGLLVESRLPDHLAAKDIAAFIPQMFGRLAQSADELKMGKVTNLQFTADNTTWQVFLVNDLYFAACGQPRAVSSTILAAIAEDLRQQSE